MQRIPLTLSNWPANKMAVRHIVIRLQETSVILLSIKNSWHDKYISALSREAITVRSVSSLISESVELMRWVWLKSSYDFPLLLHWWTTKLGLNSIFSLSCTQRLIKTVMLMLVDPSEFYIKWNAGINFHLKLYFYCRPMSINLTTIVCKIIRFNPRHI